MLLFTSFRWISHDSLATFDATQSSLQKYDKYSVCDIIITKQNKCVRSIFFAYSRENATPYYNLLGILKFENVYKFKVALFIHKILNDSRNIPTISHRTLTQASELHTHNTRFAANLNFHRPRANNNYGTSTFSFVSSKLWETIPTDFKKLPYTSFYKHY